jgi:NAD dependent epimerase/dehydratase family enzyme
VPGFALKTALGPFASEGVLIGQRLVPSVLEGSGFTFVHTDLDAALAAVLTPA